MPIHLQDYLGQHPHLLWVSLIPLFWAAELLWPRRVFVLWSLGCAAAGVTAAVLPEVWALQLMVAVVLSAVLQRWLRPRLAPQTADPVSAASPD